VKLKSFIKRHSAGWRVIMTFVGALLLLSQFPTSAIRAGARAQGSPAAAVSEPVVQVVEQSAAPGSIGGVYSSLNEASIDDSGFLLFSATLSGSSASSGVFLSAGGVTQVVAAQGQQAPGGGTFSVFHELDISSISLQGSLTVFAIFRAELQSATASEGVFLWDNGSLQAIVLAGGTSPRGKTYQSFSQSTVAAISGLTGAVYRAAFVALMSDGVKSILEYSNSGAAPSEPVSTVDILPRGTGLQRVDQPTDFFISRAGPGLGCVAQLVRGKHKKSFKQVMLVEANAGIGWSRFPFEEGRTVDSLGKLETIGTPPTVNGFTVFILLTLNSGATGLGRSDLGFVPKVFAKSGQPVPGLPGQKIQSFGAPVANPSLLKAFPHGVASVIQLQDGRKAVWFTRLVVKPLVASPELVLTDGDSVAGQVGTVSAFTAVKLTDTGTLLVQGSVTNGGQTNRALITVNGLFNPPSE
jgi:hypothetical protein